MARPYDIYLRFLVTKGLQETQQYNDELEKLCLPQVTDKEIDFHYQFVNSVLPKPVQKQVETQHLEGDFRKWMKILEVDELWSFEKPFKTTDTQYIKLVYDIHSDPRLRLTLGALLLKGVKHMDLVQSVNLKFASMLKPEHLELYEKYFWNVKRMTRADWKSYLPRTDSSERSVLFICLAEDIEAVKVTLDMPAKTSVSDMLQYLLANCYQKAKHHLRLATPENNAEARKWIDEVLKLSDKYEKHRTGDMADFSKTLQMEFDYVDTEFMTPDDQMKDDIQRAKLEAEQQLEPINDEE